MIKTIYTIPAPDYRDAKIEVYGEPENAWYEWRIIDGGRTVRDTGTEGHSAFQGRQYFQAEIALRDALMYASGLPIDGDTPADDKDLYKLIEEAKKQENYWMERALKAEEKLAQRNAKTAPNEGVWTPRFKIKGSRKWVLCSEQASNYEYIAKHVRKMQEMQKTVNWQAVRDDGLIYDPKVAKLNAEV